MSNIVVTGATGFIGRSITINLVALGHHVTALTRGADTNPNQVGMRWHSHTDYLSVPDMTKAIAGADLVIHLADTSARGGDHNAQAAMSMTKVLTEAMRVNGISRLVFSSSIYARLGTAYGNKKKTAEDFFLSEPAIAPIILRLPPVYGPGCGGGFAILCGLLKRNLPLPFKNATAPRAYISLHNLCDLMAQIVSLTPERWATAAHQIYEPSDGNDVATNTLARYIGTALGSRTVVFSVPHQILLGVGKLIGKRDALEAALSPLQTADNGNVEKNIGWRPVEALPDSLGFLEKPKKRA